MQDRMSISRGGGTYRKVAVIWPDGFEVSDCDRYKLEYEAEKNAPEEVSLNHAEQSVYDKQSQPGAAGPGTAWPGRARHGTVDYGSSLSVFGVE